LRFARTRRTYERRRASAPTARARHPECRKADNARGKRGRGTPSRGPRGQQDKPGRAALMTDVDDEAITLPMFSGVGQLAPGRLENMSGPQRSVSVRHHHASGHTPPPYAARAKPSASTRPSALDGTTGPQLLTAEEAAAALRTSRKAVYAMAERHQLPGVTRIGRRLLVRRDALLSWLDERRAASPGGTRR
jgi:excisionase family DNA binding protein